jgi:hypothetical protein
VSCAHAISAWRDYSRRRIAECDAKSRREGFREIFGNDDPALLALPVAEILGRVWRLLDNDLQCAPCAHWVARVLGTWSGRRLWQEHPELAAELDRRADLTSARRPADHIPRWRFQSRHEALVEIFGPSDLGELWRLPLGQVGQLIRGALRRDPVLIAPETTFATALGYTDLGEFRRREPDLVADLTERAHRLSCPSTKESYADL